MLEIAQLHIECDNSNDLINHLTNLDDNFIYRGQGTTHPAKPMLWRGNGCIFTFEQINKYLKSQLGNNVLNDIRERCPNIIEKLSILDISNNQAILDKTILFLCFEILTIFQLFRACIDRACIDNEIDDRPSTNIFNKDLETNFNDLEKIDFITKIINNKYPNTGESYDGGEPIIKGLGIPLSILQHHRFPTRLLDFSEDIGTALGFAAHNYEIDEKNYNGIVVYAVDKRLIHCADLDNRNNGYDGDRRFFAAQKDPLPPLFHGYFSDSISELQNPKIHEQKGCFVMPFRMNAENYYIKKMIWPSIENVISDYVHDKEIKLDKLKNHIKIFILKKRCKIASLKRKYQNPYKEVRSFTQSFVTKLKNEISSIEK